VNLGYTSYVSRNCETQSEDNILVGKLHLKDKEKYGRIILRWITEKFCGTEIDGSA